MTWNRKNGLELAAYNRAWRAAHPVKRENFVARILPFIRHRAKKGGVVFNILAKDVHAPERCPVFGVVLLYGGPRNHPCLPSLDRIDPKKGYVKGNVVVISNRANTIKNNATSSELQALATWAASMGA